ncbi:unnamed protein product, partial [Cuscuta epithymum]
MYYDCRYVSACEAAWRIFGFPIHYRDIAVERLSFHLPGEHNVFYNERESTATVLNRATVLSTKFTAWMKANEMYPEAKLLTYSEFPTKFTWKKTSKTWVPRKKRFAVGRLYFVRPGIGEKYYLRMLLNVVRGPTSFEELKTVNGTIHATFKDACYARGLLQDDKDHIGCIKQVSHWGSAHALRELFVTLLTSDELSKPELVWKQCWEDLSDDVLYNIRRNLNDQELDLSAAQIKNYALLEVEKLLQQKGKSLRNYANMPFPSVSQIDSLEHNLIHEEMRYDVDALSEEHSKLLLDMTEEQRKVYDILIASINGNHGGIYFVYGHGGTGKTYLWRTLSAAVRSRGGIVLNVASSALASLLLPGGRTAHSRFAIPLTAAEDSTCNIKHGSALAKLIQMAGLIIWDEAPMTNKYCFEALDRTMRDILRFTVTCDATKPFGGKTVVFGGDFRQILPVIPKGSRQDIVLAALNSSYLWQFCKVLKLTKNMRLTGDKNSAVLKSFADWILQIGDGVLGDDEDGESMIEIPQTFLAPFISNPIESIVRCTYPDFLENGTSPSYLTS